MPNTAKQEAIRKAYGEYWERLGKHVNEWGYISGTKYSFEDDEETSLLIEKMEKDIDCDHGTDEDCWFVRPKCLSIFDE